MCLNYTNFISKVMFIIEFTHYTSLFDGRIIVRILGYNILLLRYFIRVIC